MLIREQAGGQLSKVITDWDSGPQEASAVFSE